MRKINPKSSDADSFKYSILIYLHYYDISFHPERLSKLQPLENKYNFIHITPTKFEINNPNTSLTMLDENNKYIYIYRYIYITKNNNTNKAKNNRDAALKPFKNEFIKLDKMFFT